MSNWTSVCCLSSGIGLRHRLSVFPSFVRCFASGGGHDDNKPHPIDDPDIPRQPDMYRPESVSIAYELPWPMLNRGRLDWLFRGICLSIRPLSADVSDFLRPQWLWFKGSSPREKQKGGKRWARNNAQTKDEAEEEDEDENEQEEQFEEDEGMPTDCRTKEFIIFSRRLDSVVGRTLNTSIVSLSNWILQGRVRLNETVITKKAKEIEQGDLVEVWDAPYEENSRLATVHRLRIVRCHFNQQKGYMLKTKLWPNFITDNWVGEEAQTEEGGDGAEQTAEQNNDDESGRRTEEGPKKANE